MAKGRPLKEEPKRETNFNTRVTEPERKIMREVFEDMKNDLPVSSETDVMIYLYKKEHKRRKL